jgi:dipeptidyl aminopeptidase/acylaminoacyl peptidase
VPHDPIEQKQEIAREASPVTYASADDPPFLVVHGTDDPIVPLQRAELLQAALRQAGVSARLLEIQGAGHGHRFAVGVPPAPKWRSFCRTF